MSTVERTPGEENDRIISSIINWVCPNCGGHMLEFQCCGRCRRNWLAEWEWANYYVKRNAVDKSASSNGQRATNQAPVRQAS